MALILIPIIIAICFLLLSYLLVRSNRQLMQYKKNINHKEMELQRGKQEYNELNKRIEELTKEHAAEALYDTLTGLPSRQVFEDRLSQIINQSKRNQLTFAVVFLDLDGFKVINDALGHDAGDQLLKEVSERLKNAIRTVDTISRFIGDEFVFILSQLSKPETAAYVAHRLLHSVSQPFKVRDQELFVTASIGIALFPSDGEDAKALMKNADNALHQAKARGRNTYQFYHPDMLSISQRELILSAGLQDPNVFQDFTVFYQPLLNMRTDKIFYIQALLFWQHPDYGLIPLQDFLSLAENNGKIIEIGEWLLSQAVQRFLKWKETGIEPSAIAINVSQRQLENPRFAYKLSRLIQETKLDPSHFVLEISETKLPIFKIDSIEKMFYMLKHIGVQIALRDFGVGKLSLQSLQRLPIDHFIIANSLVRDVTVNKDSQSIVKMIISIGKSLQINVIADGIETQKQKDLLSELGCYLMGECFNFATSSRNVL